MNLCLPPRSLASSEISFRPRLEENLALRGGLYVGKGQGKRSRAADDLALLVVLRSMARAPGYQ
jgi:hypothetical protein